MNWDDVWLCNNAYLVGNFHGAPEQWWALDKFKHYCALYRTFSGHNVSDAEIWAQCIHLRKQAYRKRRIDPTDPTIWPSFPKQKPKPPNSTRERDHLRLAWDNRPDNSVAIDSCAGTLTFYEIWQEMLVMFGEEWTENRTMCALMSLRKDGEDGGGFERTGDITKPPKITR